MYLDPTKATTDVAEFGGGRSRYPRHGLPNLTSAPKKSSDSLRPSLRMEVDELRRLWPCGEGWWREKVCQICKE
jgi:hypothetical protein